MQPRPRFFERNRDKIRDMAPRLVSGLLDFGWFLAEPQVELTTPYLHTPDKVLQPYENNDSGLYLVCPPSDRAWQGLRRPYRFEPRFEVLEEFLRVNTPEDALRFARKHGPFLGSDLDHSSVELRPVYGRAIARPPGAQTGIDLGWGVRVDYVLAQASKLALVTDVIDAARALTDVEAEDAVRQSDDAEVLLIDIDTKDWTLRSHTCSDRAALAVWRDQSSPSSLPRSLRARSVLNAWTSSLLNDGLGQHVTVGFTSVYTGKGRPLGAPRLTIQPKNLIGAMWAMAAELAQAGRTALRIWCPRCQKQFIPKNRNRQYCSDTCRQAEYRKGIAKRTSTVPEKE